MHFRTWQTTGTAPGTSCGLHTLSRPHPTLIRKDCPNSGWRHIDGLLLLCACLFEATCKTFTLLTRRTNPWLPKTGPSRMKSTASCWVILAGFYLWYWRGHCCRQKSEVLRREFQRSRLVPFASGRACHSRKSVLLQPSGFSKYKSNGSAAFAQFIGHFWLEPLQNAFLLRCGRTITEVTALAMPFCRGIAPDISQIQCRAKRNRPQTRPQTLARRTARSAAKADGISRCRG